MALHPRRRGLVAAVACGAVLLIAAIAAVAGGGGGESDDRGGASRSVEETAPTSPGAAPRAEPVTSPSSVTTMTTRSAAAPLQPVAVRASATAAPAIDAAGNRVTYEPRLAIDGDPGTAWRVDGDGRGQFLTLDFGRRVHLSLVGLIPGYAKIDSLDGTDRFTQNRRVLRVRYRFDQGSPVEQTFHETPEIQYAAVDAVTTKLTVEILATTPSGGRDFTPISEVEVLGSAL